MSKHTISVGDAFWLVEEFMENLTFGKDSMLHVSSPRYANSLTIYYYKEVSL